MTTLADVDAGVRAAIAAYTQALDDGRTDDVVATYCPDGVCDIPGMGTHEGHDADIDALNAELLEGMAGQPWDVAWTQAQSARPTMLAAWHAPREPSDEAAWWIRKGAAEHYAEHLDRLRDWADGLIARRTTSSTG